MDCTVQELGEKLRAGQDFLLLDVRTDEELEIARIQQALHIPMHEIESRLAELTLWRDKEIICMCHHGGRSAIVQGFLKNRGFANTRNLAGGIHAYAGEIDSGIPQYG